MAILQQYSRELQETLPSLPKDIQRYVEQCGLHDAAFVELNFSVSEQSLSMEFIGDSMSDDVRSLARRFWFTYRGVKSFGFSKSRNVHGYPIPTTLEYVDHDRITRLSPEEIEHRIIFHDGAEFCVRFSDFALKYEDFEYIHG